MNIFYEKLDDDLIESNISQLNDWQYSNGIISRKFNFANYGETMKFTNKVAEIANAINHHPDMNVSFKSCTVVYTTHAVGGISILDFISAARLDSLIS